MTGPSTDGNTDTRMAGRLLSIAAGRTVAVLFTGVTGVTGVMDVRSVMSGTGDTGVTGVTGVAGVTPSTD